MKLVYLDQPIGKISDLSRDASWVNGYIKLNSLGKNLSPIFEDLVDDDLPYEFCDKYPEMFKVESWSVELDTGERKAIYPPAVYSDGLICFKYFDP